MAFETKRGTAGMSPETRIRVARAGGLKLSQNRAHMAAIGKKGGKAVSRDKEHMATIGRLGGRNSLGTPKK